MTNQNERAVQTVLAVAETIKELGKIPSGHLYAQLMGHLRLSQYTAIINILKKNGVVKKEGFLLIWTGP